MTSGALPETRGLAIASRKRLEHRRGRIHGLIQPLLGRFLAREDRFELGFDNVTDPTFKGLG
jgi:hypothetical protein